MSELHAKSLIVSYGDNVIIDKLDLKIAEGEITVLIGANGCGKSTLLRSLARLLTPKYGSVLLDGKEITRLSTKVVAQKVSILPQLSIAPEGLTVIQLVKQGRYPHQSWLKDWSVEDEAKVNYALEVTKMMDLAESKVDSLSGGQRQRAWIAMVLAQDTEIILLDEPTTYLDVGHEIDLLDLLFEFNEREKRTIVMVLHDLNLACRYAHNIVALKNKKIFAQGKPEDIITPSLIKEVFDIHCQIVTDPIFGTPMCIPHGLGRNILYN